MRQWRKKKIEIEHSVVFQLIYDGMIIIGTEIRTDDRYINVFKYGMSVAQLPVKTNEIVEV